MTREVVAQTADPSPEETRTGPEEEPPGPVRMRTAEAGTSGPGRVQEVPDEPVA